MSPQASPGVDSHALLVQSARKSAGVGGADGWVVWVGGGQQVVVLLYDFLCVADRCMLLCMVLIT